MGNSSILQIAQLALAALPLSIAIALSSFLLGLLLALGITLIEVKGNRFFKALIAVYVSFLRGVPTIVQLLLIAFGLPTLFGQLGVSTQEWDKSIYAILALGLMHSAYISKNLYSAYLAVDRGQVEAGLSIGMNGRQLFRRVYFPQAAVIALPNLGNSIVVIIKSTSIAFTIGIMDMMGTINSFNSRNFGSQQSEAYITAAVIYWILCILFSKLFRWVENSLKKGTRGIESTS